MATACSFGDNRTYYLFLPDRGIGPIVGRDDLELCAFEIGQPNACRKRQAGDLAMRPVDDLRPDLRRPFACWFALGV
jgi:hypothetical protein